MTRQEKGWADEYHLKVTAGSGNRWMEREDAYNEYLLFQMKYTQKKSITIHLRDVLELVQHAKEVGKTPVFLVRFGEKEGMEIDLLCVQPHHLESVSDHLERGD